MDDGLQESRAIVPEQRASVGSQAAQPHSKIVLSVVKTGPRLP